VEEPNANVTTYSYDALQSWAMEAAPGGLPQTDVPCETEGPREAERPPRAEPLGAANQPFGAEPPLASKPLLASEPPPPSEPPPASERPFDVGRAVRSVRRGPARVAGIELPANLVGVMAKPDEPRGDDRLEPWRQDQPRVTPGRGPVRGDEPSDDWQVRANAYILAKAFGTLPATVPVPPAEPPVREEPRGAREAQPAGPLPQTIGARLDHPRPARPMGTKPAAPRPPVAQTVRGGDSGLLWTPIGGTIDPQAIVQYPVQYERNHLHRSTRKTSGNDHPRLPRPRPFPFRASQREIG